MQHINKIANIHYLLEHTPVFPIHTDHSEISEVTTIYKKEKNVPVANEIMAANINKYTSKFLPLLLCQNQGQVTCQKYFHPVNLSGSHASGILVSIV